MPKSSQKHHECQNCGERFGRAEFMDYMLALSSTTIDCYKCPAENYLVPNKSLVYFAMRILCLTVIAALIYFMATFIWDLLRSGEYPIGAGRSSRVPIILTAIFMTVAIGVGIVFYRLNIKIYVWNSGWLSLDKIHKSAADYEP